MEELDLDALRAMVGAPRGGVCIAIGMLVYFRRLGWVHRRKKPFDEEHR